MGDLIERYIRPALRGLVDWLIGEPHGRVAAIAAAAYAALALLLAAMLVGLLPTPGRQQTGPLPVAPGAAPTGQILELSRQLRFEDPEGEHAAPLGDLRNMEPATRVWLDAQVCTAWPTMTRQREARAWRLTQNPGLCGPFETAFGRAPLNVALGPLFGTVLTLAAVMLLFLPLLLLWRWLPRVRAAYRQLYVSRHRTDRLAGGGGA